MPVAELVVSTALTRQPSVISRSNRQSGVDLAAHFLDAARNLFPHLPRAELGVQKLFDQRVSVPFWPMSPLPLLNTFLEA